MTWKAVWVKDFDEADYASSFVLTRGWRLSLDQYWGYSVVRDINKGGRWTWDLFGPHGWEISAGRGWDDAEDAKNDAEAYHNRRTTRND